MAGLMSVGGSKSVGCIYAALTSTFGDSSTIFEDGVVISGNRFLKDCKVRVKAYGRVTEYASASISIGGTTILSIFNGTTGSATKELSVSKGSSISSSANGTYGAWCRFSIELI